MIDVVITYVNMNDSNWLKQYASQFKDKPSQSRFFDWGLLKYAMRGIYYNMPFVNKVFLVVSSRTQVPNWVNEDNVTIVEHSEIIPAQYLPTFNSCTIEMFLHKIPGLSENYIYMNDDTIPLNPIKETDLFEEGYAKLNLSRKVMEKTKRMAFCSQCLNNTNLIKKIFNINPDNTYLRPTHTGTTFIKSQCDELFEKQKDIILNSLSQKRTIHNFNQYLFLNYLFFNKKLKRSSLTTKYFNFKTNINEILKYIRKDKSNWICVNDVNSPESAALKLKYKQLINDAFEIKFPKISKYELTETQMMEKKNLENKTCNIDFIFPYVTMNDPEWIEQYKKYCPKQDNRWNAWSSGVERFRDTGLLKYMFRSIATNMPWINKMYMIVAYESQVPKWVNRNTVRVILHKDFIPEEHLPTFNSTTIEMFIPLIKDLSDKFIYSNDDVYITGPLSPNNFFKGSAPIFHITKRIFKDGAIGDPIRKNAFLIATDRVNDEYIYDTQHICLPYVKSNMLRLYRNKCDKINKTCSKFRESYNSNQYMYLYNQVFNSSYIDKPIKSLSTIIDQRHLTKYRQNYKSYKICCLNDSNNSTDEDIRYVVKQLSNMFPRKCKYEI